MACSSTRSCRSKRGLATRGSSPSAVIGSAPRCASSSTKKNPLDSSSAHSSRAPHKSHCRPRRPSIRSVAALRPHSSIRPCRWKRIRPAGGFSRLDKRSSAAAANSPSTARPWRASSNTSTVDRSIVRFMVRRYTATDPNLRTRMPDFIVLASSSPYRRQMLDRLPLQLACRLALLKASTVAVRYPEAIVIGSDQVAEMDGLAIGKPGGHQDALQQLVAMQGRTVVFHTALAVVRRSDGRSTTDCVDTWVRFRRLQPDALERYLRLEQPYDCTGSAKIESLGICLVESVRSDDPTALIGLPLISLTSMLAGFGVALPAR